MKRWAKDAFQWHHDPDTNRWTGYLRIDINDLPKNPADDPIWMHEFDVIGSDSVLRFVFVGLRPTEFQTIPKGLGPLPLEDASNNMVSAKFASVRRAYEDVPHYNIWLTATGQIGLE